MPQSRIDILLAARDAASGPIKNVKSELGGLDKAAGSLAGGMGGLAAAVGGAGLLLLGQQALSAVAGLSELGVKATMLRESFDNLAAGAGQSGDAILAALRKASQGAISDSDLILAANRAMLLGVASTGEEMAKLMDIAAVRGRAMGATVGQAFNDIVTGLGRGSALILDNLGIVINATEANERYAQSIGKTAAALSETEKKQALINAVLADTTSAAGATVNPFERAGASIANLKDAIGEFINTSTGFPNLLNSIADAADNVTNAISEGMKATAQADMFALGDSVTQLADEWDRQAERMRQAGLGGDTAALTDASNRMQMLREAITNVGVEYNRAAAITGAPLIDLGLLALGEVAFVNTATAIAGMGVEADVTAGKLREMSNAELLASMIFNETMAQSQRTLGVIGSAAAQAGRVFAENVSGEAGLGRQQALTDELTTQVGLWKEAGYTQSQINEVLLPAYTANIAQADQALFKTTAQTKALSDATREAEQAFNDLKSKVSGVLSEALNLDVGVNPEDFLPREDAINENARRLADIMVNGLKGQDWLGSFKAAVPDLYKALAESGDPKLAAAQMLREFEAGLRPELIDKEAAKQRVRQMLLGEQNLAELAQEIASELAAEMPNVGASGIQSIVSQALGIRGDDIASGLAAGEQYAQGAVNAVSEQAPGTVMVATLTAQLKLESNLALLRGAGGDAGGVWGGGFLASVEGGVPAALIELLVRLITPGVQAGQAVKTSLEGAAP